MFRSYTRVFPSLRPTSLSLSLSCTFSLFLTFSLFFLSLSLFPSPSPSYRVGNPRSTSRTISVISDLIFPYFARRQDRSCSPTINSTTKRELHGLDALGPRATDNIAARGSESDTVNPLTRLLRVLLLESSRIIVATLLGSPWHSYYQKYRWKVCLLAVRYPLETRLLARERFSSPSRVELLNYIFLRHHAKSASAAKAWVQKNSRVLIHEDREDCRLSDIDVRDAKICDIVLSTLREKCLVSTAKASSHIVGSYV